MSDTDYALRYDALDDVNWLGIHVLRDDGLVLGPFQGKPACVRIPTGKGVCGAAAADRLHLTRETYSRERVSTRTTSF